MKGGNKKRGVQAAWQLMFGMLLPSADEPSSKRKHVHSYPAGRSLHAPVSSGVISTENARPLICCWECCLVPPPLLPAFAAATMCKRHAPTPHQRMFALCIFITFKLMQSRRVQPTIFLGHRVDRSVDKVTEISARATRHEESERFQVYFFPLNVQAEAHRRARRSSWAQHLSKHAHTAADAAELV